MKYSDKDCTGAKLVSTTTQARNRGLNYKCKIANDNILNFSSTYPTYVSLGKTADIGQTMLASFNLVWGGFLQGTSGKYIFCSNLLNYNDYIVRYAMFDFDDSRFKIQVNNTLYSWPMTKINWYAGSTVIIILYTTGVPNFLGIPGNYNLGDPTIEDVPDIDNDEVYIGAYKDKNGNMIISNSNNISNSNYYRDGIITWSIDGDNDTLINNVNHVFPLSEGNGDIVYDLKSNLTGKIISSSISNAWTIYTRRLSYNTVLGFKEDSDLNTAISKAQIPLGKDLVLYKSYFSEDNPNSFIKYDATQITQSSLSNNLTIYSSGHTPVMEFCLPLLNSNNEARISELNAGRQFKLSFKIKNATTGFNIKVTDCKCAIGLTYTSSGCTFTELSNITFNQDEEKTLEVESIPLSNTSFSSYIYFYFKFDPSTLPYVSAGSQNLKGVTIELSNIELSQTNYLTEYPYVQNGKNKSNADLDYSCLVADTIPATAGRWKIPNTWWKPMVQTSSNFGADDGDGWNITSTSRPTTNIIKNGWSVIRNSYVYYLKNHDTSDLPTGVSYGIDLKTNNYIGNTTSGMFLFNYYNTSTNKIWTERLYKFKIKFSFWYKLNDLTTNNGELAVGINFNRLFWLANKDITDTNWHYVEKEEDVVIQNTITSIYYASLGFSWRGWRDGSTQSADIVNNTYYSGSLADVKYEITPVWDSYRPIYAKMDLDKKELSNIMVYNMKQYGDNLTRIKNHVENF